MKLKWSAALLTTPDGLSTRRKMVGSFVQGICTRKNAF